MRKMGWWRIEDRGSRIGIPPRSIIFTPDWRWAPLPRSQSSARDVSLFMRHRVNTISTGLCRIRIRGRRRRREEKRKKKNITLKYETNDVFLPCARKGAQRFICVVPRTHHDVAYFRNLFFYDSLTIF